MAKTANLYARIEPDVKEQAEAIFSALGIPAAPIIESLREHFKTEPQSILIPDDAPGDVPRCVWNDVNALMTFSKIRLGFTFNFLSKFNWQELFVTFNLNS